VVAAVALGKSRDGWRERGRWDWLGGMLRMTLLNRCYRFKGFVYQSARFAEGGPKAVEGQVRARSGSRPFCRWREGCVGYDGLPERRFVSFPPTSAMQEMRRGGGAVILGRRQTHAHKRLHAVPGERSQSASTIFCTITQRSLTNSRPPPGAA
jgi:hypothetical protein